MTHELVKVFQRINIENEICLIELFRNNKMPCFYRDFSAAIDLFVYFRLYFRL